MGNRVHSIDHYINKRFSDRVEKKKGSDYIKALPDDRAFDHGFSFFLEVICLYGIILIISIHEVNKAMIEKNAEKDQISYIKQNIAGVQNDLISLSSSWSEILDSNKISQDRYNELKTAMEKSSTIFSHNIFLETQCRSYYESLKKEIGSL